MTPTNLIKQVRIFRSIMQWTGYQENDSLGYQCVALIKIFLLMIFWIKVGKAGNAIELRDNKYNVFDSKLWIRHIYDGSRKPQTWDIVFFKADKSNWNLGHVGICELNIPMGISIMEQNGGAKGNKAPWDEICIRNRKLTNCLWRYTYVMKNRNK